MSRLNMDVLIKHKKFLFLAFALLVLVAAYVFFRISIDTDNNIGEQENSLQDSVTSSLRNAVDASIEETQENATKYRKLYDQLASFEEFINLSDEDKNFVYTFAITASDEVSVEIIEYYRTNGTLSQQFESNLWCYKNTEGQKMLDCAESAKMIAENNGYLEEGMVFNIEDYISGP